MGNVGIKEPRKSYVRERLFQLQEGLCCYCERPMYIRGHDSEKSFPIRTKRGGVTPEYLATFEHLQKREEGGTDRLDNLALACSYCNSRRGALSWLEYKTKMTDYRLSEPHNQ